MRQVLVLIADPATPVVDAAIAARAAEHAPGRPEPRWLAPGIAAELPFEAPPDERRAVESAVRGALASAGVDVAVLPEAGRRRRLLVADMDSTMIGQECVDELADAVGLREHVAAITERAMRGEVAFEPALRERVALLRGLPVETIDRVLRDRITLMPGARTLVATMRAGGAYTALVSGGFTLFTWPVAARIGFDEDRSNRLVIEDGRLAGTVEEPVLGRAAKLAALEELTARLGLSRSDTLAIGDGANDLAMIAAAGLGVAFHAKPVVAEAAPVRVDHGDLTALLYLQGYRRDEFVED